MKTIDKNKRTPDEIAELIFKEAGISYQKIYLGTGQYNCFDDDAERQVWLCVLSRKDLDSKIAYFESSFGQSIHETKRQAHLKRKTGPTLAEFLQCLQFSDVENLGLWCSEYGMGVDSDSIQRTVNLYDRVLDEHKRLTDFFGEEEIAAIQSIEW